MRYYKPTEKKSKCKIYILTDRQNDYKNTEIVHVKDSDNAGIYWQHANGDRYKNWYDAPPAIQKQLQRKSWSCVKDFGYEEVSPFIFKADFVVSGAGGSSRYTDLIYFQEFLPKIHNIDKKFNPGITPGNFALLFTELLTKYPSQFKMIQRGDDLVFSGTWKFELNKNYICIAPYVEDYIKPTDEGWDD